MASSETPTVDPTLRRRVEEAAGQFRSSADEIRRLADELGRRKRHVALHLHAVASRLDAAAGVLEAEVRVGPDPGTSVSGVNLGRRALLFGLLAVTTGAAEHVGAELIDALRGEDSKVAHAASEVHDAAGPSGPEIGERFLVSVVGVDEDRVMVDCVGQDQQSLVALSREVFDRAEMGTLLPLAPGETIEMIAVGGPIDGDETRWVPIGRHPG